MANIENCQCGGLCGQHHGMCDVSDPAEFGVGSSVSRHGVLCRRCTQADDLNPSTVGLRLTMQTVNLSTFEGRETRFVEYATLPRGLTRDGVQQVTQQLLQRFSANIEIQTDAAFDAYGEAEKGAPDETGVRFIRDPEGTWPSPEHESNVPLDTPLNGWQPTITAAVMRLVSFLAQRPALRGAVVGWLALTSIVGVATGLPVNAAALLGGAGSLSPTDILLARARLDVLLWAIGLCVAVPALVFVLGHYRRQRMLRRRLDESSTRPFLWPGVARVAEAMKFNTDAIDIGAEHRRMRSRVLASLALADPTERMFCELIWHIRDDN